jgi:hypothetical protein
VSAGVRLEISDLGPEMLEHTMRGVGDRGLVNITAANARQVRYRSGTLDGNSGLMFSRRPDGRLGCCARLDRAAASGGGV